MTTPSVACAVSCIDSGSAARRPHPRGFDRAVMRVGLALLLWARRRTERRVELHAQVAAVQVTSVQVTSVQVTSVQVTSEQQQLRLAQQRALVQRERGWALREYRVTR